MTNFLPCRMASTVPQLPISKTEHGAALNGTVMEVGVA